MCAARPRRLRGRKRKRVLSPEEELDGCDTEVPPSEAPSKMTSSKKPAIVTKDVAPAPGWSISGLILKSLIPLLQSDLNLKVLSNVHEQTLI